MTPARMAAILGKQTSRRNKLALLAACIVAGAYIISKD